MRENPTIIPSEKLESRAKIISNQLNLNLLTNRFGRTPEQTKELSLNFARVVEISCERKGIDPSTIRLETIIEDIGTKIGQYSKNKGVLAFAGHGRIGIPIETLLSWSNNSMLDKLELSQIIAHETHHIWMAQKFPKYKARLAEEKGKLMIKINQAEGKEKSKLQDRYYAIDSSSYAEISAQLFARQILEEEIIPQMAPKDRLLAATLSLVDFSKDMWEKRMRLLYQHLQGNPITV